MKTFFKNIKNTEQKTALDNKNDTINVPLEVYRDNGTQN